MGYVKWFRICKKSILWFVTILASLGDREGSSSGSFRRLYFHHLIPRHQPQKVRSTLRWSWDEWNYPNRRIVQNSRWGKVQKYVLFYKTLFDRVLIFQLFTYTSPCASWFQRDWSNLCRITKNYCRTWSRLLCHSIKESNMLIQLLQNRGVCLSLEINHSKCLKEWENMMFSRILHCWQNMWVYITSLPYSYVELRCSKYEKYGKNSKPTHKHSNWQKHKNQFTNNNQPTVNSKQQKTNNKQQQKVKKQQQINICKRHCIYNIKSVRTCLMILIHGKHSTYLANFAIFCASCTSCRRWVSDPLQTFFPYQWK